MVGEQAYIHFYSSSFEIPAKKGLLDFDVFAEKVEESNSIIMVGRRRSTKVRKEEKEVDIEGTSETLLPKVEFEKALGRSKHLGWCLATYLISTA